MKLTTNISVLVAEDHPLMRKGLIDTINEQEGMSVIAEAASGSAVVEQYRLHRPDVAVIDYRMPDGDGITAIETIRKTYPLAKTIVLTTAAGDAQISRALRAGVCGYLLKHAVKTDLVQTIRLVASGQRKISPQAACSMAEFALDDDLSPREIEVLCRASAGSSNKMIASELCLSEHTVKSHFKSILNKLRANDRTHAVMIALKRGYLDFPNYQ